MDKQLLLTRILYLSDDIREYAVLALQNCKLIKQYFLIFDLGLSYDEIKEEMNLFEEIFLEIRNNMKNLILKSENNNDEKYISAAKVLLKKNTDSFALANLKLITLLVSLSEKKELSPLAPFFNHIILEQQLSLKKTYANQ